MGSTNLEDNPVQESEEGLSKESYNFGEDNSEVERQNSDHICLSLIHI